ncbi:MAG: oligosaccharide flippase family protein [Anaerolineales bacterium]|nr:oligosaccharide flippase family protein [Anaerolineales bacterium]
MAGQLIEAQNTVRNAGMLVVQWGVQMGGALLTAVIVPRMMGPEIYGQYSLVTSLSIWFVLFSELGLTQVLGRFGSHFAQNQRLKPFFELLLTVRFLSGAGVAGLYLIITLLWLQDIDPNVLAFLAAVVWMRAVADLFFSLFLGANRSARWGMGQIIRGWVTLVFLPAGFYLGGLSGAAVGLLLAEFVVLALGVRWAWPYLGRPGLRFDFNSVLPQLRFGLVLFGGNLVLAAFRRSGEAIVRIAAADYVEVGYFGLAYHIAMTAATAVPQLTLSFSPLFSSWLEEGDESRVRHWIEVLVKSFAILGVLFIFAILFLGYDLVPFVLGPNYDPVAANLAPLAFSVLAMSISAVAQLLALVYDRPGTITAAAILRLVAFWVLGPVLVVWKQSLGGCIAALAAMVVYAVFLNWRMQRVAPFSLKKWVQAALLGGLFLPLLWLRSTWLINGFLFAISLVGYGGLIALFRIITREEIMGVWRLVRKSSLAR